VSRLPAALQPVDPRAPLLARRLMCVTDRHRRAVGVGEAQEVNRAVRAAHADNQRVGSHDEAGNGAISDEDDIPELDDDEDGDDAGFEEDYEEEAE